MPQENNKLIFKSWVPYWLVLFTIFITLIPIGSVLGIYMSGISSATTYYGVAVRDIQYSIVAYYFAIASFFPFEARFFNYFSSRPYWVACSILYVGINVLLYYSHSFVMLFIMRFVGGMVSLGFIGIMFSLVFRQFHAQRSRVLGYATMYAGLFASAPLAQLLDAHLFFHYNFNVLFLVKMYSALPGVLLMCIILKKDSDLRREGKIPLKNIEWPSFVLYASAFLLIGYIALYGQYYGWFHSQRIVFSMMAFVLVLTLFVLRQLRIKEPYINLRVFKSRNFRIGMLLLILFYVSKGDMGLLNSFFRESMHLDEYYKGYSMLFNAVGIISGSLISARFILAGRRIRLIWLTGFASLLLYHIYMLRILGVQAEMTDLIIPLFLQGFGNGTLIISIVIFYVTAVPPEIGFSASVTGVAFRATTFTANLGLLSMVALYLQKQHSIIFSKELVANNPMLTERLSNYHNAMQQVGLIASESHTGAMKLLGKSLATQNNLLFVRDYYLYMSIFIGLVMMSIALIPHFKYTIRKIGEKLIPM